MESAAVFTKACVSRLCHISVGLTFASLDSLSTPSEALSSAFNRVVSLIEVLYGVRSFSLAVSRHELRRLLSLPRENTAQRGNETHTVRFVQETEDPHRRSRNWYANVLSREDFARLNPNIYTFECISSFERKREDASWQEQECWSNP